MSTPALVAIIVAVLVVVGVVVYLTQRRARLKKQFGPEYDRVVQDAGNLSRAESLLEARARRVRKYEIRALSREERARFIDLWRQLQARFIDDPAGSVAEADRLVGELMTARGYPMADFERHVEDLSVHYPHVIEHYRDAHAIAVLHARDGASTEDLRQAVVHYRFLFDDLLDVHEPERKRA
jgi:hypothetical protein